MKIYIVFISTEIYQEIGSVHLSLEKAQHEANQWNGTHFDNFSSFYPEAGIVEREIKFTAEDLKVLQDFVRD